MGRDASKLHPRLQTKLAQLKKLCEKEGLKLGIGECYRTVAEQNALYAKGRTKAGSVVTNAKGNSYSSQHQWGIAFDFFKNVADHEYSDAKFFNRVGALAKTLGLGWGGDWKSPVDKPHLYLKDWGSTTAKLKKEYGTPTKFKATWPKKEAAKPAAKPAVKKTVAKKKKVAKKKTVTQIAREVISGKWGKGVQRVVKLKKAGYSPIAVQKEVNKLMK